MPPGRASPDHSASIPPPAHAGDQTSTPPARETLANRAPAIANTGP